MPKNLDNYQKKWINSYKVKELPHWAESLKPSKLAFDFIKLLQKNGIKKGKVLEAGCGNGRDGFFIAQQGFKVVGIDISPEAINLCKDNKKYFIEKKLIKKSQVDFLKGNIEKLSFEKDSFVGGYSLGVLHSTDLKKSLKELARVVKKNGIVMIQMFEKTLFLSSNKENQYYSPKEIKDVLAKLPFIILKFKSGLTIIDHDKKLGTHKHFSTIIILKKVH
ncbi:MAG: class I SAM-dependent methyltransferase [Candidatus Pacebacteria bacterium]|nr:class I SAM-dependent methyltransferase [Candidatus Paceibacterota bacterium]